MTFSQFKVLYVLFTIASLIAVKYMTPLDKSWKVKVFMVIFFVDCLLLSLIVILITWLPNSNPITF